MLGADGAAFQKGCCGRQVVLRVSNIKVLTGTRCVARYSVHIIYMGNA
jgi:hypothetical protein